MQRELASNPFFVLIGTREERTPVEYPAWNDVDRRSIHWLKLPRPLTTFPRTYLMFSRISEPADTGTELPSQAGAIRVGGAFLIGYDSQIRLPSRLDYW